MNKTNIAGGRCCWMLLLLLLSGAVLPSYAQDLQVKSFQRMERDLLARTQERLDLNEEPCAIVRVSVAGAKNYVFEGNVVGEVIYHPGEAIVYMPGRTRYLVVKSDRAGTLKFDFPERLEKRVVYKLDLKLVLSEDQKTRTLVMPVMGVGSTPSYGAMIGLVKKTGAYAKVKYNFRGLGTDYECDGNGLVAGSDAPSWFTGDSRSTRLALTAGLLQRLWKPAYLYAGAGYGYKKLGWELADGNWAESTDDSCSGVEAELGGIFRIKNIALSAGVQTNQFKYWEATLGIGIMF